MNAKDKLREEIHAQVANTKGFSVNSPQWHFARGENTGLLKAMEILELCSNTEEIIIDADKKYKIIIIDRVYTLSLNNAELNGATLDIPRRAYFESNTIDGKFKALRDSAFQDTPRSITFTMKCVESSVEEPAVVMLNINQEGKENQDQVSRVERDHPGQEKGGI